MAGAALSNDVSAGTLRQTVQIVKLGGTRDAGGDLEEVPVATVRAAVAAASGQARYMVQEFAGRFSHVITIRYRTGIEVGMKALFRSRVFKVVYPLNPEEANSWLHLLCMEEIATPAGGGQ